MIDEELVKHVAALARIRLADEEISRFSSQLSSVLDYMKILEEVDVEGVEETSQVTGLKNVMEKDEILPSQSTREEMLECSELEKDSNQVRVQKTI
ncbi:Asp-tRNA(Asn)/Glu-tRNA(Gln) amidotransferase subunit GatC [Candidatus Peregrinibacteria bacterium]|nr:Asp-tRNA(Asn)/Glu-tRNA(Gln) amidotransferase subunit GatC [Candidatus Peregrinibacteria bacterium]